LKTAEKQSLASDPASTAPKGSETEKPAARILLAEDDPMIRKIFTIMLAKQGWQAETAKSGKEAVEKSAGGNFDIILMDLQMPEMSGIEATRAIRERELQEGKRTYIIGLTAHGHLEVHKECLASGMDKVLTKPIQMKDLILALEDSCS
jgi:CheY-like chemotaxis protein